MRDQKNCFLFYFDSYPALVSLPPEQRGWLITALCVYADRVWREETPVDQFLKSFPQLSDQARVAFQFMAGNICRDTQKWLQQRQARIQRRQQTAPGQPAPQPSLEEQERNFLENQARLRRLVEQSRDV